MEMVISKFRAGHDRETVILISKQDTLISNGVQSLLGFHVPNMNPRVFVSNRSARQRCQTKVLIAEVVPEIGDRFFHYYPSAPVVVVPPITGREIPM